MDSGSARGRGILNTGERVRLDAERVREETAGKLGVGDLEVVFDAVPALVFIIAADDTFLGYRAGSIPLYVPPETFLGRPVEAVLPGNVGVAIRKALAEARATGRQGLVEYDLPLPGGTGHFEARLVPLGGGRVAALVMDMTEPWRAQERLRESEERLRVAFTMSPDAVNISRLEDGVYIAVNESFSRLSGFQESEVLGHTSAELGLWADRSHRTSLFEALRAGGVVDDVEMAFRRKDGTTGTGLLSTRVVSIGGQPCLLTVTRDITDRKREEVERAALEAQLRQAQKMEAIGRLAGGVAHDFNNILTSILSTAELMKGKLAPGHPCRTDAEQIKEDALRAAELTRQLLAFARRQMVAPRAIRVDERASSMEKMLSRVLGENVILAGEFAEDCWPVLIDPGQFEQVIVNLAVNARDAMPDGGRLTISAENVTVGTGQRLGELSSGDYVRVTVTDSGSGMSGEVLTHIFEPFFTTKGAHGVGLGLATCYGIVRQSGGDILVESTPGAGSRFHVYLPRAATTAEPEPEEKAQDARGSETVLVVEDDAHVRSVAVRILSELGYHILEAGDAREAQVRADAYVGPIDVAIMDVVLPDGNGRDAAKVLCARRPGLSVLFVSGYAEDLLIHKGVAARGIHFLPKPYTPRDLASAVRRTLDSGKVGGNAGA